MIRGTQPTAVILPDMVDWDWGMEGLEVINFVFSGSLTSMRLNKPFNNYCLTTRWFLYILNIESPRRGHLLLLQKPYKFGLYDVLRGFFYIHPSGHHLNVMGLLSVEIALIPYPFIFSFFDFLIWCLIFSK